MSESYGRRGYAQRGYAEREYAGREYAGREYAEREYGRGGQKSTRAGGVILAALGLLCTFLVIWGLYYATGTGERHKVALAAAGCEPNLLSNNVPCVTVQMLYGQYKSMANPVIQQVNADVADYTANEMHNLTVAEAALGAEVTTENGFDTSLARFPFPPSVAPIAKTLIRDIQAEVKLTTQQARSSSLSQMRSFDGQVGVTSAAVRTELGLVTKAVKTPVTPNQEP
jgi:hypothetical protein